MPNSTEVDIRERIYWATSVLAFIDNRGPQTSPMHAFTSSIGSHTDTSDSRVEALNNFCILLSRGTEKESHHSVLVGPRLAQSFSIVVVVSRTHDPTAQTRPAAQNYEQHIRVDKRIISPAECATIDDILKIDPTIVDFHHYVQMAIRALKWGAENQSLQDQVSLFFLSHCFPKIKRRFTFVDRAYFHDNSLAEWKYQDGDEPFADSKIHIGHPELQQLLRNLQIPQDVKNRFDFTEELSTKWFQAILTLFKVYRTGFDDVRPNISSILCASTMSSLLLRKIPEIFWRLESLNQALGNSRLNAEQRWYTENKRDIPDSPIEMSVDPIDNLQFVQGHGPADTSSEQDSTLSPEDEDEIKEWESLLLNSELVEKLEKQSIPYQSQLFVASIESVNSWTRAVASICRRRYLCQARIHLDVKIFEIPGMPLRDPTPSEVEALRRRWTQQLTVGQLSNFQTILATTRGSKTPRPGCHSEAVIMAVFLCKEAADELDKLPPKVREAFRDIIELNQHYNYGEQDYIPIGVSTPICATCRLFERSLFWNAHMTFGCASRTGKCAPWIPPSWTPKQNLIELESALLEKLMDKLPHTSW